MDHLKMHTPNKADENFRKLAELFPNAVTEAKNEQGEVVRAIDKDVLMQEINTKVVEGREERYQFTWPDKRKAVNFANVPIAKTLRPCREKSVNFDTTENLYIEGDNLEVLKLLQETYLGKIKMIYIDPPYNTGNDFVYEDDYSMDNAQFIMQNGGYDEQGNRLFKNMDTNGRFHTDWLNMMYPRLKLARDLLTEDGVIFISIDDNEQENLKKICDEIFGSANFITQMIWQSTAGSNTGTDIVTVTESIYVYTKNKNDCTFDGMLASETSYTLSDEFEQTRGKYALDKLDRRRVGGHYSPALDYPIKMPDGTLRYPGGGDKQSTEAWNYLWSASKVKWGVENGFIVFKNKDGQWNVYNKRYALVDNDGKSIERTIPFRNLITSEQCNTAQGTQEMRVIFPFRVFDFPKPTTLIRQLLLSAVRTEQDVLILDFFSGSATTAHAVMQLNAEDGGNRKFIMVQIPEKTDEKSEAYKAGYTNICEIGKERIRRAAKKIAKENPNARFDGGFRVLKCDSSNMKDVYYSPESYNGTFLNSLTENIKEDRTPEDLLFQVMLDLGILLSSKITETVIGGKKVFDVADGFLIACFDDTVTDEVVTEIAKKKPQYFVMRDSSLAKDSVATNFDQIFALYSPYTTRKVL
ncbi:MAG: DNA methyltransferase [Candidatus Treponema excrementipullorum]|nr:DNA methyltransferase [Candidatus Treponema excrementipullorum]